MALVLAWNRTGMEIKGRDDLTPLYVCVCVGCGAGRFLRRSSSKLNFLSVNDAYLTDLRSSTSLLQSPACGIFSHVLNFAAEQDAAASQRSPTVTSSHVLSSTE